MVQGSVTETTGKDIADEPALFRSSGDESNGIVRNRKPTQQTSDDSAATDSVYSVDKAGYSTYLFAWWKWATFGWIRGLLGWFQVKQTRA